MHHIFEVFIGYTNEGISAGLEEKLMDISFAHSEQLMENTCAHSANEMNSLLNLIHIGHKFYVIQFYSYPSYDADCDEGFKGTILENKCKEVVVFHFHAAEEYSNFLPSS